ncbi:MAG: heavy-metal-associated domain-containing protein [Anaerolineaceae bacterium]|nr:heavy-metal-associated domain-containing protein [Anaerolineaceae bacterium]
MKKKIYSIPDMHCINCKIKLEGIEDSLTGVKMANASYQKQRLEVEFDETVVSEEEILQAIRKLGYSVQTMH